MKFVGMFNMVNWTQSRLTIFYCYCIWHKRSAHN